MAAKFLMFAMVTEIGVALAMLVDPALVTSLLLGKRLSGTGALAGRFFGIALLGLVLACWPGVPRGEGGPKVLRALLTYNALFAIYLAYLGTLGGVGGVMLWPAVAFHVVVALVLIRLPDDAGDAGAIDP